MPPFSPTLNSKLPCFFGPTCFSSSAMRASRSPLLGSVMGIHSGGIFRATLGFYRRFSEPFFLLSAHRFFLISDNRFLPSGVRRPPLFLLRVTEIGNGTSLCSGPWRKSFPCCYGLTESVSFTLQFCHDSDLSLPKTPFSLSRLNLNGCHDSLLTPCSRS